ncbi:MAG: cation:proton antiporter [Janthinobacterium lividum]
MQAPSLIAMLLTLTGAFAYLNDRFLKFPLSVGLMGLSLTLSLLLIVGEFLGLPIRGWASATVAQINFSETLLDGMLSFMLFAGALHVDLDELREQKATVAVLATVGVVVSTVLVGLGTWAAFRLLNLPLPLLGCLTFGALISPTDPIAVMGLLKEINAPKSLSTKIAGESLFNDGVGIVVFLLLLRIWASGSGSFRWEHTLELLLREVGGGVVIGLLLGYLCYTLLRSIDNYQVEVMLTVAFVSGGYQLASSLHSSGPLAIVTAGIYIGNYGRKRAMTNTTRMHLDAFWEMIDEILNGILFVLIGLEVLVLTFQRGYLSAALASIPLVLAARFLSLAFPLFAMKVFRGVETPITILTWGGLRGGLSIAMALSLPPSNAREIIVICTYAIVTFAILVQATTMPWLLRRVVQPEQA